jgi:hypothetical protein
MTFHVSPSGDDASAGSAEKPFRSIARARDAVRQNHDGAGAMEVVLHGGTYYLPETLVFTAEDAGTKQSPVRYVAARGERVIVSGGRRLALQWSPYKNGILRASIPEVKEGRLAFDQLFVNGELQHLARYPNFDPKAKHYNGTAADAIAPARLKTWAHPETAILHAMHTGQWGDMHWQITGVDAKGNAILQGGQQNNRPSPPHRDLRFVENVFEELDAPGEWFLDKPGGTLYFMPPDGVDLAGAGIEVAGLEHLVELRGTADKPVQFVTFEGLTFTHAARTFMQAYEPLLRSDWSIYRGGALLLEGARDCTIKDCNLEKLGGNALFVSRHNRRISVTGSRFTDIGASCVAFVGDPSAVRMPGVRNYNDAIDFKNLDTTPGPKNEQYPADCTVSDCLMFHFGTVEKQVAGVEIAMASRITVSHCSIYDCPRAGINIGDGCWGGHVVEFCDVFDTVKETGDHGSFNSWGRDRYWRLTGKSLEAAIKEVPNLVTLDVIEPITLRDSRWRCDHGWDIDLDDGSSNYRIYNNLCLHGGLKNREGFDRVVENNVIVDNTFHPHVWYRQSGDIFRHNIVMTAYQPIRLAEWGKEVDHNLFPNDKALKAAEKNGTDAHSLFGDPQFIDPAAGDYRVKETSPALKAGFKNFRMDQFGVTSDRLKSEARTPLLTNITAPANLSKRDPRPRAWLGATVKNVVGLGEQSAAGLPEERGVVIVEIAESSPLKAGGLRVGEVILGVNGKRVDTVQDLVRLYDVVPAGGDVELNVYRNQSAGTARVRKGK